MSTPPPDDERTDQAESPPDPVFVEISPTIADLVRDGLRSQIANAAQLIVNANDLTDARQNPDRYREPLRHIDALQALMNELGWEASSENAAVDLSRHEWALTCALRDEISVLPSLIRENWEETEFRETTEAQLRELIPFTLTVLLELLANRARTVTA